MPRGDERGEAPDGSVPATAVTDISQFTSPVVATSAMRLVSRFELADRGVTMPANVVISQRAGPAATAVLRRRPHGQLHPGVDDRRRDGPEHHGAQLLDRLDFGLIADRELVPDLWDMVDMHIDEIGRLFEATGATWVEPQPAPSMRRGGSSREAGPARARRRSAAAKKAAGEEDRGQEDARRRRRAAKKTAAKKTAAKKTRRPKKTAAKKTAAKKTAAKKTAAKKTAAKKTAAKKTAAQDSADAATSDRARRRRRRRRLVAGRVSRGVGCDRATRACVSRPVDGIASDRTTSRPSSAGSASGGETARRWTSTCRRRPPPPARGPRLARRAPRRPRHANSPRPATWCRTGRRRGGWTPTRSSS